MCVCACVWPGAEYPPSYNLSEFLLCFWSSRLFYPYSELLLLVSQQNSYGFLPSTTGPTFMYFNLCTLPIALKFAFFLKHFSTASCWATCILSPISIKLIILQICRNHIIMTRGWLKMDVFLLGLFFKLSNIFSSIFGDRDFSKKIVCL